MQLRKIRARITLIRFYDLLCFVCFLFWKPLWFIIFVLHLTARFELRFSMGKCEILRIFHEDADDPRKYHLLHSIFLGSPPVLPFRLRMVGSAWLLWNWPLLANFIPSVSFIALYVEVFGLYMNRPLCTVCGTATNPYPSSVFWLSYCLRYNSASLQAHPLNIPRSLFNFGLTAPTCWGMPSSQRLRTLCVRWRPRDFSPHYHHVTNLGPVSGFVEVCIMHPLDLIKTRMQLQGVKAEIVTAAQAADQFYYNGVYDCIRKMYTHEGILSFYKGIIPPILAETPKRAVKVYVFDDELMRANHLPV